jgi:hypothetical protein
MRYEVTQQLGIVHDRLTTIETSVVTNAQMTVEAIKAANALATKRTAAWVAILVSLLGALGTVAAAWVKAH